MLRELVVKGSKKLLYHQQEVRTGYLEVHWGGGGWSGGEALSLPVGFALQQKGARLSLSLPRMMVIISSVF